MTDDEEYIYVKGASDAAFEAIKEYVERLPIPDPDKIRIAVAGAKLNATAMAIAFAIVRSEIVKRPNGKSHKDPVDR